MHALLIVALVLPWVLVAAMVFVLYVLIKQHGEFLIREQHVGHAGHDGSEPAPQSGLAVGSEAPDVVLNDLEGRERRIGEFFGEPFVLTFFNTACGYCRELAPQLSELPEGAPRMVLVSSGDPEELRGLAGEHGWKFDVLREDDNWTAFSSYEPVGTPSAYLVDSEGKIAEALAVGSEDVLQLLEFAPARPNGPGRS
jgi:peroxiredoxin